MLRLVMRIFQIIAGCCPMNSSDNPINILEVSNLKVYYEVNVKTGFFRSTKHPLKAVDDVSFKLKAGETLSIVGESGCGKSTLGRAILGLTPAISGKIIYQNTNLLDLTGTEFRDIRKELQIIFQDPLASLNPRMTVGEIIAEPFQNFYPQLSKTIIKEKVKHIMSEVGLLGEHFNRYPHEFSGGQCQRIGIARALILKPKVLVCDEAVSALDVSVQAQIINLLKTLQKKYELSLIFIAHDLSVVRYISDKVLVMYLGKVVEMSDIRTIFNSPAHPYTQSLLSAVPVPDPEIERKKKIVLLKGELPSPLYPPIGCNFNTRCPKAFAKCFSVEPELKNLNNERDVSCHLY